MKIFVCAETGLVLEEIESDDGSIENCQSICNDLGLVMGNVFDNEDGSITIFTEE